MPEKQILVSYRTCNPCAAQGVNRVGSKYEIAVTSFGPMGHEGETLADDGTILCDDHARPLRELVDTLYQHPVKGDPDVIVISSMEELRAHQPAPAELPPPSAPEATRSGHQPDTPPPPQAVVPELPTQQAKIRCLEEDCGAELLYNGIGPHKRSKHPNTKDLDWEFIELPEGNPVYECRQPRSTGGRCKAKYTRLEEIVRHQQRERHVDPQWSIKLRNRKEEAAAKV